MRKVLLILTLTFMSLFGEIQYIGQSSQIYSKGEEIGKIFALTPVEVVKESGERTLIKIKGVVHENYQEVIQKSISLGEKYIEFKDENSIFFEKIKDIEDDYGEVWIELEGEYEVQSSALFKNVDGIYEQAKTQYEQACSSCHTVHEPESFTTNQWPATFKSMIDSGYVSMSQEEIDLIVMYLQQHSKDSKSQ